MNMEIRKKALSILKRFFPLCWRYGFSVGFWSVVFPFHKLFAPFRVFFGTKKHKTIFCYLLEHYSSVIENFAKKNVEPGSKIAPESTIWVCWWDGFDSMPPIAKACYDSILRHAGTHPVQLISKFNFKDFISIPEYILRKVDAGIITVTHFSNIVRANLLYEHGGIWMDATIWVAQDISIAGLPFYTLKAPAPKSSSVTLARFAGLANPVARINDDTPPQTSRWSGFLLAGAKHSIVFDYMREILYAYWKDHDDQIDYVLYDYTIALGYEYIPAFKGLVDGIQCSPVEKFEMEKNLGKKFSKEMFSQYCTTPFHKLTWKQNFALYNTKNQELTVYGYLLSLSSAEVLGQLQLEDGK